MVILLLLIGCDPEVGKVRGRVSRGSAPASTSAPATRFVIDSGDATYTYRVLERVRARLEPVGVHESSAKIAGDEVQVVVDGDKHDEVAKALAGGRVDVHAGKELLIRGEFVNGAVAGDEGLTLSFEGPRKSAIARAVESERELVIDIDGETVARLAPSSPEVRAEAGELVVKMDKTRAEQLAKGLTGRALSHKTGIREKIVE